MERAHIELDTAKCQSYGKCLSLAPKAFAWDRSRKVKLNDIKSASDALAIKVAKNCPYRAIAVIDESSRVPSRRTR